MTLRKVCLGVLLGLAWLPAMSQDVAPLGPVNIAPEVTLDAPTNGQQFVTGTTITLWASAFDMDDPLPTVQFLVDGAVVGTAYPGNYSVDWVVTAGSHTVAAKATDARNKSTTTPAITITGVANQAPSVSLTAPSNGASYTTGATVTMSATASDADGSIDRVEFLVDGTEVGQDTSSPYSRSWTATVGSHSVQARAVDNLGKPRTTTAITINVAAPNQPPSVSLTEPDGGEHYITGSAVTFTATASDADGSIDRVEFLVDGTEVGQDTSSPYSLSWTATVGNHTIQARAVDDDGAPKTTSPVSITVAANQAPTVSLTAPANGAQLTAGTAVTLTATASDPDGSIDRVEFLVDGTEIGQDTSSPYSRSWTVQPGSHTIQARAVDDLGKAKTSSAITVQGVMAPVTASATRQYVYNQYQQLCKVIEPETGATLMGYDAAGNLAWSATGLPAGTACDLEGDTAAILARKAVRTYDARNRITALEFADGKADVDYTYTPAGQLATITAANGGGNNVVTTSYTYNRRGLLVHEGQLLAGSTWSHDWTIDYAYDPNGHLSQQTVHAYGAPHTVAYAPNALGQPTQAGTYATGVSYYPNGAMKQFTYGNGIVHTLTRNVRGLPDRSLDAYGSTKFLDDGYDYDANGNVAAISDGATGQNQRGNRTMSYDGLDRLTAVQSPMYGATGTSYQYDTLDNLRHVVAPGRNHGYCYDANNRLTAIRNGSCSGTVVTSLGYDVQGNLATKAGVSYGFDQGNRLRAVSSPASIYLYDGHGRRVRDASPDSRYSVYSQSGQLVFDYNKRDITYNWYVHLNGSLVATRTRNYDTGVEHTRYQHTDALGSPVVVTNESRTIVKRNEYEPYGKLVGAAMEDGPGYTGHMADAPTGLVYMQQRYYDPVIGMFLSVDPVTALKGGPQHFNRYAYAYNNPYKFTDPDGRQSRFGSSHQEGDRIEQMRRRAEQEQEAREKRRADLRAASDRFAGVSALAQRPDGKYPMPGYIGWKTGAPEMAWTSEQLDSAGAVVTGSAVIGGSAILIEAGTPYVAAGLSAARNSPVVRKAAFAGCMTIGVFMCGKPGVQPGIGAYTRQQEGFANMRKYAPQLAEKIERWLYKYD